MQGVSRGIRLRPSLRLRSVLVICFLAMAESAHAQAVKVARTKPKPRLFIFVALGVSASPTAVSFNLVHGGAANGSATVVVTTSYLLGVSLSGQLALYGYFSSAPNAMTGGSPSSSIPSSDIFGEVPGGLPTSFTAFTQTTPYSGASGLELYYRTSIPTISGSFVDDLSLRIDLTATPNLPAAVYTGTLTLEAQSF